MKRIGFLLIILCVFSFCGLSNSFANKLFSNFKTGIVCFYCDDINESIENVNIQKNGEGYIVETDIKNALEVSNNIVGCNGFSLKINKNEENIENFINQIEIIGQEIVSNIKIIYGYVCGLVNSIYIDGKKVNIEIAENGDFITIGSPIILGSY